MKETTKSQKREFDFKSRSTGRMKRYKKKNTEMKIEARKNTKKTTSIYLTKNQKPSKK